MCAYSNHSISSEISILNCWAVSVNQKELPVVFALTRIFANFVGGKKGWWSLSGVFEVLVRSKIPHFLLCSVLKRFNLKSVEEKVGLKRQPAQHPTTQCLLLRKYVKLELVVPVVSSGTTSSTFSFVGSVSLATHFYLEITPINLCRLPVLPLEASGNNKDGIHSY